MNLYFHCYPHLVVERISEEDDSVMIYDSNARKFFSMNSTAGTILLNCEGKSIDEIAAIVRERYDLQDKGEQEIHAELNEFISEMVKNEILYCNSSRLSQIDARE